MNGWMDDDIETKELGIFLRFLKTWLVDIIGSNRDIFYK